jgi:hypothetical protein
MTQKNWDLTQDKVEEYTANGRFIPIAGYEWTSQAKYWMPAEPLFPGPRKLYNHKNVYFPSRVPYIFSAKDAAYNSPARLAEAIQKTGGLIQNNHPFGDESRDQWEYPPACYSVIANTEIGPDQLRYDGKDYRPNWEAEVQAFLNRGGRTGFVKGTDTHDGKPAARTAVLAAELTRPAIFEALRHRRNYAVSNARIVVDFKINGHAMGEEITVEGAPRIVVDVQGTAKIAEVAVVRDGSVVHSVAPASEKTKVEHVDQTFRGDSYYYVRVTQVDVDEHGNPSQAWSSPIWCRRR